MKIYAIKQAFSYECVTEKYISYLLTKTYVVGTQKNRLNETVLFTTQSIYLKLLVRKYIQFYAENFCLSKPMIKGIILTHLAYRVNGKKNVIYPTIIQSFEVRGKKALADVICYCKMTSVTALDGVKSFLQLFVKFDSLRPINNLSIM